MDVEITELEKIDADRVDGVGMPANGIPILMMKQVGEPVAEPVAELAAKGARDCPKCDKSYDADHTGSKCENCGTDLPDAAAAKAEFDRDAALELVKAIVGRKVDETPDIAGGTAVLAQIADLIIAEAQELKSGVAGEIADIQQLACAAEMIWCWRTGEESVASGSVMPATALMQSVAAKALINDMVAKGDITLNDGRALMGLEPLDLSPEGVANPLDDTDDTSKSQIADEGTTVDTVTQAGELTELVKAADAKAAVLEKRIDDQVSLIKALEGRLAKVEAAPVAGGPVMSVVRPSTAADGEDHAAKALYFEEWADRLSDPSEQANYRQLAARERAKILS